MVANVSLKHNWISEQEPTTRNKHCTTTTMNTPNDPHAPQSDDGARSSQQNYSNGTFFGLNAMSNVHGNASNPPMVKQSYLVNQNIPQQSLSLHQTGATQQHGLGLPVVNPMVASSFVEPSSSLNLMMPNQNAFYAYMQQQPGSGHLTMGGNPYSAPISNPYEFQTLNSTQFIGRDVQWQSIGDSGTTTQNGEYVMTTGTSCRFDGKNNASEGEVELQEDDDDRIQSLRDRNRVHARSARQRKKAYVHQLKSLVETLHTERNEEMRKRTVAAQRIVDIQKNRRRVMVMFLNYHSRYETDQRKWSSIVEDTFWLKQPITPFRSFRRSEIENECRISRGLDAIINDAASLSVMLESIGCYSSRWVRIKRDKFLHLEESKRCPNKKKPSCIVKQDSRLLHTISSPTCSTESISQKEDEDQSLMNNQNNTTMSKDSNSNANKVSSSSGGSGGSGSDGGSNGSNAPQNFHAKQPQDREKSEPNNSRSDSRHTDESPAEDSSDISFDGPVKRPVNSDLSSSEYDSDLPLSLKRRKFDPNGYIAGTINLPTNISSNGEVTHPIRLTSTRHQDKSADIVSNGRQMPQYPTVAMKIEDHVKNGPHVIVADIGDGSSDSDDSISPQIKGQYHFNDDDIMITDDVSMCPFVFRSHNAVICGAMAECVMSGMLRARFSDRNKLLSIELVYDAMGFMQQLERASGSDVTAQIIPGSLDMALSPSSQEARVITLAQPPYLIVNVNEVWTRITGFTQIESEGIGYLQLLEGDATIDDAKHRPGKPEHLFDRVAKGQPACSTNIHYDRSGRDFIEFVCSYPLTNSGDEVTHILHVSRELPSFDSPIGAS